jgi:hypothetical protein
LAHLGDLAPLSRDRGGLHRLDFAAWLRARPVWDIVVITLVLGGLAGSLTGAYLAPGAKRHGRAVPAVTGTPR